jgi:hypothetical protein
MELEEIALSSRGSVHHHRVSFSFTIVRRLVDEVILAGRWSLLLWFLLMVAMFAFMTCGFLWNVRKEEIYLRKSRQCSAE